MLEKEAELALTNNELAELEEYQVSRNYLISVFSLLIFTVLLTLLHFHILMVFTLRHSCHVGGRKQKISN